MLYSRPLAELIAQFEQLPGVGPKSAQRLAFHILKMPSDNVRMISQALIHAKENLFLCSCCQNVSDKEICDFCQNPGRDPTVICVVGEPQDVVAIERAQGFKGRYHVLHGLLNPINGVGPDRLKIKELLARVNDSLEEVILATNPTIEGDATALYLAKFLKPLTIKVTRLAHGMPKGGELDYADSATLLSAIEYRREL